MLKQEFFRNMYHNKARMFAILTLILLLKKIYFASLSLKRKDT